MAISFVAAGTDVTPSGGNLSIPVPSGVAAADLLIAVVTTGAITVTTPTGWTQLFFYQTAAPYTYIFYKYASASETTLVIATASTQAKAVMLAYRGGGAFQVVPTVATGTGTTATPNAVTTTYANDYIISLYTTSNAAATWTANGSTTSRVNSAATASFNGILVADEAQDSIGSSTPRGATLSVSRAWVAVAIGLIESGRTLYWAGGTGNWDTSTTTNWSPVSALSFTASCSGSALTTTGSPALVVGMRVWSSTNAFLGFITSGSANSWVVSIGGTYASQTMTAATTGVVQPSAWDNVIINTASSVGTITLTNAVCQDLTVTASQALTMGTSVNDRLSLFGSMSLPSGGSFGIYGFSWFITFAATTTGKTITTNGKALPGIIFNGVGGGWTLGSDLTMGNASASTITFTNGTFNTGNFNITSVLSGFVYSATGTVTLNLGSSTIALGNTAPWPFGTTTGLTFNANTSTINFTSGAGFTFAGGGLTYYNVTLNSAGATASNTNTFTGANTFNNLTFTAPTSGGYIQTTFNANQVINGTLTAGGATATNRVWLKSTTTGTARTFTSAAVSLSNTDFTDITGAGAAAPFTGTNLGNATGNSGITFTTAKIVYWNLAGTQNWNANGWALSSGGTPAVGNFPLPQDTCVFDNAGAITQITINAIWNIGTVDMSNRTSAMTFNTGNASNSPSIYGDWKNGSGTTLTGLSTGAINFVGRNTQSITSASKTFGQPVTISSLGGTVQFVDAFSLLGTVPLTLSLGGLNTNSQSVSIGTFASNFGNVRTITLGSSTITVSGTGSAWAFSSTNGTVNAASSTIILSDNSTTTRSFDGGVYTYGTLTIGGATSTSITQISSVVGGATFATINTTKTVAHTIQLGGQINVTNWEITGTAGNVVTLASTLVGSRRVLNYIGSSTAVSMDYMSITDIDGRPSTSATQPYVWYAGANSTNGGSNTGIAFIASTFRAYLLTTGTQWTIPSDWNDASNTIHMIGGGAGGATAAVSGNNRAAGGGGGGGGYTAITNFTVTASPTSYQIGGGGAGNASGTATTFNITNIAGGGLVGTASIVPSSTGGAGGTGTNAGGTGGAGSFGTTASQGYGAGGAGGAGGPNGVGGAGGNGFGSTTAAQISGGGGGGNGGGSAGGNASSALGGTGGNNFGGTGGATGGAGAGAAGTFGGGGAGGALSGNQGGNGGSGIDIANTIGGAGGKGGATTGSTINTGVYGGGGTGGGVNIAGTASAGSAGSQGVIFIVYTPLARISASISESSTLADAVSVINQYFGVSSTEPTTLADTETTQANFNSAATEPTTLADTETTQANFNSDATEPTTLADTSSFTYTISVDITEPLNSGDSALYTAIFASAITETLGSDNSQSYLAVFNQAVTENSTLENTQTVTAVFAGTLTEAATLAEAQSIQANLNSAITEALNSADIDVSQVNFQSSIAENAGLADTETAIKAVISAITEDLSSADSQNRQAILFSSLSEASNIANTQAVQANFNSQITENLVLLDNSIGRGWFRVVDDQTVVWTSVNNGQTVTWQNVGNDQNPNWQRIDNTQE